MNGLFALDSRLAVVTGAAQGNGRAIALGLAEAGADVVIVDVNADLAAKTVAEIRRLGRRAWSFELDISDREACEDCAEAVARDAGNVSILVNNAGILRRGPVDAPDALEAWRATMSINVDGAFHMVRAFLPALRHSKGTIINLGSIQSFIATPNSAAYTASKGAIMQLTRALAAELARDEIRVNGIAPGFMETAMTKFALSSPERMQALLAHVPMRRVGQPSELVGAVVFLASAASSYITGVMLPVDGGYITV